jgi:hypothetical protein
MEAGRMMISTPVLEKDSSPVCFKIDPLSKTSDLSVLMS